MKGLAIALAIASTLTACASVVLAPGAESVKITSNAAEVQGCKPLGSVGLSSGSVIFRGSGKAAREKPAIAEPRIEVAA